MIAVQYAESFLEMMSLMTILTLSIVMIMEKKTIPKQASDMLPLNFLRFSGDAAAFNTHCLRTCNNKIKQAQRKTPT